MVHEQMRHEMCVSMTLTTFQLSLLHYMLGQYKDCAGKLNKSRNVLCTYEICSNTNNKKNGYLNLAPSSVSSDTLLSSLKAAVHDRFGI